MRNRLIVPTLLAAAMVSACVLVQPQAPGLDLGRRTLVPDGPTPTSPEAAPLAATGVHPIGVTPALDH